MAMVIAMRQQVDSVDYPVVVVDRRWLHLHRCTVYTHFSLRKPVAA